LLDQAREQGVLAVVFTGGGEPLRNENTVAAIDAAKALSMDVGLITNGSLITASSARTIVRNCDWCRISLDAAGPTGYARAHGVAKQEWEAVLSGVHQLVSQRNTCAAGITIGLGYLVDEVTVGGVQELIGLAGRLGVDYVQLRPFRGTPFDVRPMMTALRAAAGGSGVRVLCSAGRYEAMAAPRRYAECWAPDFSLAVGADYKLYACCETKYRPEAALGDLARASLAGVLRGAVRQAKAGIIYEFCPHPCRHDASNTLLARILMPAIHKNFV
jgi:hypothetical protein